MVFYCFWPTDSFHPLEAQALNNNVVSVSCRNMHYFFLDCILIRWSRCISYTLCGNKPDVYLAVAIDGLLNNLPTPKRFWLLFQISSFGLFAQLQYQLQAQQNSIQSMNPTVNQQIHPSLNPELQNFILSRTMNKSHWDQQKRRQRSVQPAHQYH